jgi:hypothetical protein
VYKYVKIALILFVLSILSGCENNPLSSDEAEAFTTLNNTTTSAITENDIVPLTQLEKAISMAQPYLDNGGVLYDLNNDNFPEMIAASKPYNQYMYSIYDLSAEKPELLGEFFINDDVNGSVCKIYKCYDDANNEFFYITEESFAHYGYIESYIKKIEIFSDGVLYDTIVSKKEFYNDLQSFYILNDNGNIITGNNDDETAVAYFDNKYEIVDIFTIGKSAYKTNEFSSQPIIENKSFTCDNSLYIDDKCVRNYDSTTYSIYILNEKDLENTLRLNKYSKLTELSIIDEYYILNEYSFLSDFKDLKMLEIKSDISLSLQDMISKMTNLHYLSYNGEGEYSTLDFLKNCSNLEAVYLGKGIQSDADNAYEVLYSMPNIKVIAFSGMGNYVTEEQYLNIKNNIPDCMIVYIK